MTNQNQNQKLYYHKLGTPQSADVLIYEDPEHPLRSVGGGLTDDERFLVLRQSEGTSGSQISVKDMKDPNGKFILLVKGFDTEANTIDNDGDRILIRTNNDAPNYR